VADRITDDAAADRYVGALVQFVVAESVDRKPVRAESLDPRP
jgi:hypothetical protein